MRRGILGAAAAVLCAALLASCSPQSADSLIKGARREHGECTVISKTDSEEGARVVLHDTLQDFDYTVSSRMSELSVDGASFGSFPDTSDSFEKSLGEKVFSEVKGEIDDACAKTGSRYEKVDYHRLPVFYSPSEEAARTLGDTAGSLFQSQNLKGRMDGWMLVFFIEDGKDQKYGGSVTLPDTAFKNTIQEKVDYFTDLAVKMDENARYLRKESVTLGELGYEPDDVVNILGTDYPTERSSDVTLYFFEGSDGQEFYIADFLVYDKDHNMIRPTSFKGDNT